MINEVYETLRYEDFGDDGETFEFEVAESRILDALAEKLFEETKDTITDKESAKAMAKYILEYLGFKYDIMNDEYLNDYKEWLLDYFEDEARSEYDNLIDAEEERQEARRDFERSCR